MKHVSPWYGCRMVAFGVAALAWAPPANAQTEPARPATAIISSGGSASVPPPESQGSTLRPSATAADPWTATRHPPDGSSPAGNRLASHGGDPSPLRQVARNDGGIGPTAGASVANSVAPSAAISHPSEDAASARTPLAPPSKSSGTDRPATPGTLGAMVSVGSSLLVVVGLFLGVAWCYRRTLSSAGAGGLPKQVVQVLGRTAISGRQQMVLLRFGSKLVLVSVIQGEARTISEISDPLEVDQLAGLCASGQSDSISNSFKSVLRGEGVKWKA